MWKPVVLDRDDVLYDPDICEFKREGIDYKDTQKIPNPHSAAGVERPEVWADDQFIGIFTVSEVKPGGWAFKQGIPVG